MSDKSGRERDLILAPNEYAYILDETKGNVINYVGPHKTSLANTDQPVTFKDTSKRFERCNLDRAIQSFAIAPEGWYLVLKNPAKDNLPPRSGTANNMPELNVGNKIIIPGPCAFAPWPGQMVQVIQGHRLRSNQYLIVRIFNEQAARDNWGTSVMEPVDGAPPLTPPDLTIGNLLIIHGTEVSFYIPSTGIEVVADAESRFVRDAVTLEQLEYCTLLDESGAKRYIQGPAVVFPKPTESFVTRDDCRKFKAIELNEISGLYIKVITAYEEDGKSYQVGDELFITGREQMIYFPRSEHAIIRYGDAELNYAVAIPAGEARYVLERLTGQITLKRGPQILLPDPRREVIVRRVLDPKQVSLWFPGNEEALSYNQRLLEITHASGRDAYVGDHEARQIMETTLEQDPSPMEADLVEFVGDAFSRKETHTQPRTLTLDTKYEGAVAINVWTGYAVLIVSKGGERRVFEGPGTYILEYDEILEAIELSTGTPKSDDDLMRTVYLRTLHNKISDLVTAETADLCQIRLHLSYRVNFTDDPEKWFQVENYVKFLTDHLRSLIRNAVKHHNIESFHANYIEIVRDTVLGIKEDANDRSGRRFEENGMHVYDVEVLDITIGDENIEELLIEAQHDTVRKNLELSADKKSLEILEERELVRRKIANAEAQTEQSLLEIKQLMVAGRLQLDLAEVSAKVSCRVHELEAQTNEQNSLDEIAASERARYEAQANLDLKLSGLKLNQDLEKLRAEINAVVEKAGAISPQLTATLSSFSDRALAERLAETMAPLGILGGRSVADVFAQLLKGTVLEDVLSKRAKELPQDTKSTAAEPE